MTVRGAQVLDTNCSVRLLEFWVQNVPASLYCKKLRKMSAHLFEPSAFGARL